MGFKCCVRNCPSTTKQSHCFPNDSQLLRKWLLLIDRPDLLEKHIKTVRRNYRVCKDHFDESSIFPNVNNRTTLKQGSVPTRNLPGPNVEINIDVPMKQQDDHGPDFKLQSSNELEFAEGGNSEIDTGMPMEQITEHASDSHCETPTSQFMKLGAVKYARSPRKNKRVEGLSKKIHLLQEMGLQKTAHLTPRKEKLYNITKNYIKLSRQLRDENASTRDSLKAIVHSVETGEIFKKQVNSTTWDFLKCQFQQQSKRQRGRRFTLNDKLLALLLLKQSPKGYKLLKKFFALPSRKTLMALLKRVPFQPGLNKPVLQSMENQVKKMDEINRHCVLLLDEVSLQPSLCYSKSHDCIIGFEDDGETKKAKLADHAMVFMIKGLAKQWKQPIAYYFSENGMKRENVAKNIKQLIKALQDIGLKVVTTVCDQYNASAINMLVEEAQMNKTREGGQHHFYSFFVGEEEIFPIYDAPHLLKGIRNNMLNGDVHFQWKKGPQVAKWDHVIETYELDGVAGDVDFADPNISDFRILHKLTDEHVYRDQIKKMKVKNASQIFSQTLSATMRSFALGNRISKDAIGTADFLLFMDRLFDSVNGSTIEPQSGKLFRCAVKKTSLHMDFWAEAKKVLKTIKFVKGGKTSVPPSVKNWIITIDGLMELWNRLQKKGFQFFMTRNVNQDSLENFFGAIRSHGVRNINPTCSSFQSSFKSLIINNFMSPHSPGSNCEEDQSTGALDSLRDFIFGKEDDSLLGIVPLKDIPDDNFRFGVVTNQQTIQLENYLTGYLCKKIFKVVGVCKSCRQILLSDDASSDHLLIEMKDFTGHSLLKPRTKFATLFNLCCQVARFYMPKLAIEPNIKTTLLSLLESKLTVHFPTCEKHNTVGLFRKYFCMFFVYSYVKNVNSIILGKHSKNINDPIKKQSLIRHLKYKKQQRAVRRQKRLVPGP